MTFSLKLHAAVNTWDIMTTFTLLERYFNYLSNNILYAMVSQLGVR